MASHPLREAQRLERTQRTLRDWLEDCPDPEDAAPQAPDWQFDPEDMNVAAADWQTPEHGPRTPEQEAEAVQEAEIWQAVVAADAEEMQALGRCAD